ncbi:MAG TPA: hypothetical protein IAB66_05480 [Candidatus Caccousia avistercoris]|nr:hypothetical protein [Candidatus Caccousia avistercoris]
MSKYVNMSVCDLRGLGLEEACQVKEIVNTALVVFPSDSEPELESALAAIPMRNVACTLRLPRKEKLSTRNGLAVLTEADLKQEGTLVVNGLCVVPTHVEAPLRQLVINGTLIHQKNTALSLLVMNGEDIAVDFDEFLQINDDIELDVELMQEAEKKTLFLINGDLEIPEEVTPALLKEKEPYFVVNGDVSCPTKAHAAYLRLHGRLNGGLDVTG